MMARDAGRLCLRALTLCCCIVAPSLAPAKGLHWEERLDRVLDVVFPEEVDVRFMSLGTRQEWTRATVALPAEMTLCGVALAAGSLVELHPRWLGNDLQGAAGTFITLPAGGAPLAGVQAKVVECVAGEFKQVVLGTLLEPRAWEGNSIPAGTRVWWHASGQGGGMAGFAASVALRAGDLMVPEYAHVTIDPRGYVVQLSHPSSHRVKVGTATCLLGSGEMGVIDLHPGAGLKMCRLAEPWVVGRYTAQDWVFVYASGAPEIVHLGAAAVVEGKTCEVGAVVELEESGAVREVRGC